MTAALLLVLAAAASVQPDAEAAHLAAVAPADPAPAAEPQANPARADAPQANPATAAGPETKQAAATVAQASDSPPAAEPVAMAELPGIGDDPAVRVAVRGTPASLPPVTAQLFKLAGRTEAQPMFQISIGDPFYRTYLLGVRVEHHLDERFSLGVHALGGGSSVSAPIQMCGSSACDAPSAARLRSTPGNIQLMTGIEVGWAPIYGKLSLAGEKTLHFDAYLSLGPELIRERIAPDGASDPTGRWALGGRFSIGERMFFSDRWMIRAGISQVLYGSPVRGRMELERKLSLEGGVAWLFGGSK